MDRHIGFESWLERDHVMQLDYNPDVVGFSSQPFWLYWAVNDGSRRHAPDYFVRRADGTAVVLDVRADERIEDRDAVAFEATRLACEMVGWRSQRLGVLAATLCRNLRWLSRYRHRRCSGDATIAARLVEVFTRPTALLSGAASVGDTLCVLPSLFHLMWRQVLTAELEDAALGPSTLVWSVGGSR